MATTEATLRAFFQSTRYAVVGASSNPQKFGHKGMTPCSSLYTHIVGSNHNVIVFVWYLNHNLPVTPINPASATIDVGKKQYPAVNALSGLESPKETGVSIITPPHVTLKALGEAKDLGIPSVWLQPGTFDDEVLRYARDNFATVLAGDGGWGSEGWCILVDGERGMRSAGKL